MRFNKLKDIITNLNKKYLIWGFILLLSSISILSFAIYKASAENDEYNLDDKNVNISVNNDGSYNVSRTDSLVSLYQFIDTDEETSQAIQEKIDSKYSVYETMADIDKSISSDLSALEEKYKKDLEALSIEYQKIDNEYKAEMDNIERQHTAKKDDITQELDEIAKNMSEIKANADICIRNCGSTESCQKNCQSDEEGQVARQQALAAELQAKAATIEQDYATDKRNAEIKRDTNKQKIDQEIQSKDEKYNSNKTEIQRSLDEEIAANEDELSKLNKDILSQLQDSNLYPQKNNWENVTNNVIQATEVPKTNSSYKILWIKGVDQSGNNVYSIKMINTYKVVQVQFNGNGGQVPFSDTEYMDSVTKTYEYNTTFGILPTPKRDNYVFSGWYDEETDGNEVLSSTSVPSSDVILYAYWTENGGTEDTPSSDQPSNPVNELSSNGTTISLPNGFLTNEMNFAAKNVTDATEGANLKSKFVNPAHLKIINLSLKNAANNDIELNGNTVKITTDIPVGFDPTTLKVYEEINGERILIPGLVKDNKVSFNLSKLGNVALVNLGTSDATTNDKAEVSTDPSSDIDGTVDLPSNVEIKDPILDIKDTTNSNSDVTNKFDDMDKVLVIDTSLKNSDGTEVNLNGNKVTESIKIPDGWDSNLIEIYEIVNGERVKIDSKIENGMIVFETDHLGQFILAQSKSTMNSNDSASNPKTGDINIISIYIMIGISIIGIVGSLILILKSKKKK